MARRLGILALLVAAACSPDRPKPPSPEELFRDGRAALARGQTDRAMALLGQAIERRPGHVETRLWHVKALLAGRRTREAEKSLREGLARQGRDASLWLELGRVLAGQGKHDQAVRALERARALAPENVEVVLALGKIYEEHGEAEVARTLFRATLARADAAHRIRLHRQLARLADARGQAAEALAERRLALGLAPERGELLVELGVALRRAGRSAEARSVLTKAVERLPGDGEARLALGLTLRDMEQHREAAAILREAVRLLPGRAEAVAALCDSELGLGEPKRAYDTCVRALALDPTNPKRQWRMVPLYLERGLVEPAGELLGQLVAARAHDPTYWELVAQVAEGRGDHAAAEEAWAKAFTLRPRDLALRRRLGFAARRAGDYAGALRHLEPVLKAKPDDYDALVHLAIAAEHAGQRQRAAQALDRAHRLGPKRPEAVVYLAWLAHRAGRLKEAVDRAIEADRLAQGKSAAALDVLATALGALGRKEEARAALERAEALPMSAKDREYLTARRAALEPPGRAPPPGAPPPRSSPPGAPPPRSSPPGAPPPRSPPPRSGP